MDRSKRAGVKERKKVVRQMLLEGHSQIEIMKTARVSGRVVAQVRRTMDGMIFCKCGRQLGHPGCCIFRNGRNPQEVESYQKRIREMLLEGFSAREVAIATGSGPALIKSVRESLGNLQCRCGKPSSHSGVCEFKRSLRQCRTRETPPALAARRERFTAFLRSSCDNGGRESRHVGAVKFRIYNLDLRVVSIHRGERFIAKMVDGEGNVFVWSGKLKICPAINELRTMDATVRSHEEWSGQKQTVLTRCSFSSPAVPQVGGAAESDGDPVAMLIRRMNSGDRRAFEAFVAQHQGCVFVTAFRILRDHAEAEDIKQNVFAKLWNIALAGRLRLSGNAAGFVCRIARNMAFEELKRRSVFTSFEEERLIA